MPVKCLLGGCSREHAQNRPARVGLGNLGCCKGITQHVWVPGFSLQHRGQKLKAIRLEAATKRLVEMLTTWGRVVGQATAPSQPFYLKAEAPGSKVVLTPKYLTWCYIFSKLLADGKQFCSCVIQPEEFSRLLWTQQFQVLWGVLNT